MRSLLNLTKTHLLLLALLAIAACGGPATTAPETDNGTGGDVVETPNGDAEPGGETSDTSQGADNGEQVAKDHTIIPGERVGPVTPETSREDLAQLYGEDNLEDQSIPMGEGFTEPGTLVDLGPEQQFAIVWLDETQTRPLLAKDFGTAWQTPEGLGVGVPYGTVKSVLGNFQLYGFAWDYEGSLVLEGSNLDQYYGDLLLRVRPSQESVEAHPKEYQAVMGDALFAGDDPNLEPLDIQVYEMTVYLNPLTEE
jgi:hypothetical protein